jgi:hypothetical protein
MPKTRHKVWVSDTERAAGALDAHNLAIAVQSLQINGCVLLEAVLDPGLCAKACCAAEADIRAVLDGVGRTYPELLPLQDVIYSAEVCQRSEGGRRYDLRIDLGMSSPPYRKLLEQMRVWTRPLLARSGLVGPAGPDGAGRVYTAGCVTSLAGGVAQGFHRDGDDAGCVNIFCPLVDVGPHNGATELVLGSHVLSRHAAAELIALSAKSAEAFADSAAVVQACCRVGSLLLFDFRMCHRGARHEPTLEGREGLAAPARPMLYSVVARTGTELWDFFDHPPLAGPKSGSLAAAADGTDGAAAGQGRLRRLHDAARVSEQAVGCVALVQTTPAGYA